MGGRFLKYLQATGRTQLSLSRETGVAASILSRFCSGGVITSDNLCRLVEGCPDLSLDWLFFGSGPMLRSASCPDVVSDGSVLVKDANGVTVSNGPGGVLIDAIQEKDRVISEKDRVISERDITIQRLHELLLRNH